MKKIFLLAILLASISIGASANPKHGKRGANEGKALKELNLTADQEKKIDALNTQYQAKFRALKDNEKLSKDERREEGRNLMVSKRQQINQILTPEQQTKLKESRKNRSSKKGYSKEMAMRNKKHNRTNSNERMNKRPHGGNMIKQLELTDTQKEQMMVLNKSYQVKEDDLRQQRKADMEKLLTPQQKAKMQTLRVEKLAQRHKISIEGASKLQALRESYQQEKKMVQMSRIAPEMQKERLFDLKNKFKAESRGIVKQYKL